LFVESAQFHEMGIREEGGSQMSAATEIDRVQAIVDPIAADLHVDVYDIERRGGTIRITLDSPAGSERGINMDELALATRLISRQMDEVDPIPGHYTLEVTSPGLERQLRTPAHFQREIGKPVTVRFADPSADPRRLDGQLVAADEHTATLLLDSGDERVVTISAIDKARTVFAFGPKPKPGREKSGSAKPGGKSGAVKSGSGTSGSAKNSKPRDSKSNSSKASISTKETQPS
jgi:ribosome maturation factor RimP